MSRVKANEKWMNPPPMKYTETAPPKNDQEEESRKFREWLESKGMSFNAYRNKSQAIRTQIREEFTAETGFGKQTLLNMKWIRARRAHGHTPQTDEADRDKRWADTLLMKQDYRAWEDMHRADLMRQGNL